MKKNSKPPALFRKKYTEKKFRKKIQKKLYVPADKAFVESFFSTYTDSKKGNCYVFNKEMALSKTDAKRLARIAKEIKKQKGRFNFVTIGAVAMCLAVLVLSLTVFRNQIAHFALVSTLESTFGARVSIGLVDVDLLDACFTVGGLEVANKKEPMKNLFSIGKMELYFDILELSRGKLVSNNIELTGVTWNTERSISGSLPPRKQKKHVEQDKREKKTTPAKPNSVSVAISEEVNKLKSGVSVDAGIDAVTSQLDPVVFFEAQKDSLLTPAVAERIQVEIPVLIDSWKTKTSDIRGTVDTVMQDGAAVMSLNVKTIKTVEEAKTALETINSAVKTVEKTSSTVSDLAKDVSADVKMVEELSREAELAIKGDAERVKALSDSVQSFDFADGTKLISGVFENFVVSTLGIYYPYMEKGLAFLKTIQATNAKNKKQTLKAKSSVVARLPGRDFNFGVDSLPRILFKNIHLSALDTASSLSAEARVQNITNDADRLGVPTLFTGMGGFKALKFALDGTVDLRSEADEIVRTAVNGSGFSLSVGSSSGSKIPGVPSIKGSLELDGNVSVLADDAIRISGKGFIQDAAVTVQPFKPEMVYSAYSGVFSRVSSVEAGLALHISPNSGFKMDLETDLDTILASALKEEAAAQIEEFKADVIKAGNAYLEEQKKVYADEIARIEDVLARADAVIKEFENYEDIIDDKKKEIEKRITALVTEKADLLKKSVQDATQKVADQAAKEAAALKKAGEEAAAQAAQEIAAAQKAAEKAAEEAAEKAAKEAAEKAASELKKKFSGF